MLVAATALFCGGWLALAAIAIKRAGKAAHAAGLERNRSEQIRQLLDSSPVTPLIIHPDGRIDGAERLVAKASLPDRTFDEFVDDALASSEALALKQAVDAVRRGGKPFSILATVVATGRRLEISGGPAPSSFPIGAILLWSRDATGSEQRVEGLQRDVHRLNAALDDLSGLIEVAPFPIWHRGPDLRLAMVNGAYVRAVDAGDALAVVRSGIELADEGEGRNALSQAASVVRQKQPLSRIVPATIAGERRMMRVVEVPTGQGVAGYAIDVEDLEQARSDLARFVRAQRDMLDRLSAGVAQFARDRSLVFVNQPFMRLFGLGGDLLTDQPEFDRLLDHMRERRILPEVRDFPEWKQERRAWFTSDEAREEDWLLPGGRHLRVVAQPLPDGGLLLIFEDRTEQNQLSSARDTLLRARAATFDNLFEAIGVFASDGRLHLWNNRFRELWGFEEDQLAGHPRIDALIPAISSRLKRASRGALVRELVRSATVERKQRHGRASFADGREFAFAAVPLPDGNALFTMLDVTDSRRIEAALRERNDALEEADRVKTAFVSNMSYELRTPLTSIGGFAEMLAAGYAGPLPPMAVDYVEAITQSVTRLSSLVDNVLDLTQSDVGGLLLAEDQVDIRALCMRAAEQEAEAGARKDIVISLDVEASAGEIIGDTRRLGQALGAVMRNAVGYTGEGGRVLIHATGTARAVQIVISDNGPGIAPADQARMFDRFQRNRDRADGPGAALGLGLPLTRQFVEAHGGSVRLESAVGVGTSVTFFLPRSR